MLSLVAIARNKGLTLIFPLKNYKRKLASCLKVLLFHVFPSDPDKNIFILL